jgi:predicted RNase H-like HicB family nuclease
VAGTLPHAVFVETGVDEAGRAMAFAGELPGCAAVGDDPASAVAAVPTRVTEFVAWLRARGEPLAEPIGNWYEVERAAAGESADGGRRRASFSLDELPPSADEFATWLGWAELAREELAAALDLQPAAAAQMAWLAAQDAALAAELGTPGPGDQAAADLDRIYAARDALTTALITAGPAGAGVRRALRLAIADDLRAVELVSAR